MLGFVSEALTHCNFVSINKAEIIIKHNFINSNIGHFCLKGKGTLSFPVVCYQHRDICQSYFSEAQALGHYIVDNFEVVICLPMINLFTHMPLCITSDPITLFMKGLTSS